MKKDKRVSEKNARLSLLPASWLAEDYFLRPVCKEHLVTPDHFSFLA